jgi:uncharacterized protein (DUF2141 family)
MSVQAVAWLAVLVLANLPTLAWAQSASCPGIHVQILNIRNSTGTVDCALFDVPIGFPINDASALLGAPSFAAASLAYDGRNLELTIRLQY